MSLVVLFTRAAIDLSQFACSQPSRVVRILRPEHPEDSLRFCPLIAVKAGNSSLRHTWRGLAISNSAMLSYCRCFSSFDKHDDRRASLVQSSLVGGYAGATQKLAPNFPAGAFSSTDANPDTASAQNQPRASLLLHAVVIHGSSQIEDLVQHVRQRISISCLQETFFVPPFKGLEYQTNIAMPFRVNKDWASAFRG